MPAISPREVTTDSAYTRPARPEPRSASSKISKKDFLQILARAGVPQETVKATDEQLQDPIDLERDGIFLVRHGLDRDQLINRMGGSP
jgi:hypothetical protein